MYEKDIENAVCKYAREKGLLAYKFVSPNTVGVPDRIFFAPGGGMFMIEFKRPGGKMTPSQERTFIKLSGMGFDVYVIDDVDAGKRVINGHLS